MRNWTSKEINSPRGAWTDNALRRKGNPSRASVAQNMRYSPGVAQSREGTSVVFSGTTGAVKSLYNWLSPSSNELVYLDGSTAKSRKLSAGTTTTLASSLSTTQALSCAELGPRLYFCGFTTALAGSTQCRVWDGSSAVDTAFRAPLTVSVFSGADGGAGECTRGTHYLGFVFQSRSGFAGQPSPVNGSSVFTPASVTLNAQQRKITVSLTMDTPADGGGSAVLYPIVTRASNPNIWYFVPDLSVAVPASQVAWSTTFDIDISDEDLASRAESADNQFNLLVQAAAGTGPFSPNFVAPYGKRMTYGVGNKVYVSEIDAPQEVTEDFNVVQMPHQRSITAGKQLGQDFFMFGDRWTGRVSDNGDLPSTWSTPAVVSDSIGTIAPQVEPGKDNEWLWVASSRGLELFTGKYDEHPLSYYISDIWARINQAAAYCIQIADDVTNLKVHVAVPLDGATSPTHDLVFDYTQGKTFESIDFSLDNYAASTFSSIRAVKEASTGKTAVYIGPSAAGRVLKLDPSTHDDVNGLTGSAAAVSAVWESGYIRRPGEMGSKTVRVGNADLWIRGDGALTHLWKGQDGTPSVTPVLMSAGCTVVTDLSDTPGQEYSARADLSPVENYTFRFQVNSAGAWFQLSGFRPYYKQGLWTR